MEKLVSILTPCYNGEKFVWRLLDSVLNQTYPHIEMFVIDDGSTDNSAELIRSYIPRFEAKGYTLTYVYQENSGQSVAINNGLKLIAGDYLVWPDCDDWYAADDAIEQMVECLDLSGEDVSMVRCKSNLLDEITLERIGEFSVNSRTKGKTDLFTDCLFGLNGFWHVPGDYMAKVNTLDAAIPGRNIYTDKSAGQNWQLMLPLLYNHNCLTIDKFLYNVLVRNESHSRMRSTLDHQLRKYDSYENTLLHTVDNIADMPVEEKDRYKRSIRTNYQAVRLFFFMRYRDFKGAGAFFAGLDGASKIATIRHLVKTVGRKSLEKLGR